MINFKLQPQRLLWLDLEMTGLDPRKDLILEAAAIVTDWGFKELEAFESGVRQDQAVAERLLAANDFAASRPEETRALVEVAVAGAEPEAVERQLIELVSRHFPEPQPALLAGNSIHMDRQFIRSYWPNLEALLHYRMLDVSAWKVVAQGKFGLQFTKKEAHRALDDIRESIAELQFYMRYFKPRG